MSYQNQTKHRTGSIQGRSFRPRKPNSAVEWSKAIGRYEDCLKKTI